MNQAVTIIRQRVDASGVGEADVTTEGGKNIVVQIPGQADERDPSAHRGIRAAAAARRARRRAARDDLRRRGRQGDAVPDARPDAGGHADGGAHQRQRPRVDHARAAGRVPRLRLRESRQRPRERAAGSAADHVRSGRHGQVHPRTGRARRLIDRRRDLRSAADQRPVGGQPQVRRRGHQDVRRDQPAAVRRRPAAEPVRVRARRLRALALRR